MMKECKKCLLCKPTDTDFYAAGRKRKTFQSTCKSCHNKSRSTYSRSSYKAKLTGYGALSEELRTKIEKELLNKVSVKKICTTYDLKYQNFLLWRKKGQLSHIGISC